MKKKFIAYDGQEFTIEWYYTSRGKSEAFDYFDELSEERKNKLTYLFYAMGDAGKISSIEKFRNEGDKVYAFKPSPDRFLCFFFQGSKIIITNAFEKKSEKIPPREKERALRAKQDYITRCLKGEYYD